MHNLNVLWSNVVLIVLYGVAFLLILWNLTRASNPQLIISNISDQELIQGSRQHQKHYYGKGESDSGYGDDLIIPDDKIEPPGTQIKQNIRNEDYEDSVGDEEDAEKPESLTSLCVPGMDSTCPPPFKEFPSKYRYSLTYHLTACVIEKSMSTFLAAIMCYLYDTKAFRAANRTLSGDLYENRFCKDKNEGKTLGDIRKNHPKERWHYLTVVREPVDRFLSGFVDKCVLERKNPNPCYGCNGNLSCFIHTQYQRTMDFAHFKLHTVSYEDVHFHPQSWRCNFKDYLPKYRILQYESEGEPFESMTRQLVTILQEAGVKEQETSWISEQMLSNRTRHSTFQSDERIKYERELRTSPELLKIITKMFYYDFVLFGFPFPTLQRN